MRMYDKCLPCVISQVIKVADITGVDQKDELLREVFAYLSKMDFASTTPEVIGDIFEMIKRYTNNQDPYKETRNYYNALFMKYIPQFEAIIERAQDPFLMAVRYAIAGNIIDFNPIHNTLLKDVLHCFDNMEQLEFAMNDSVALKKELQGAQTLLYLGDNCGEICLDKILLRKIKELNPCLRILFGVRGKPVVNDSIEEDAYAVGIDAYAEIISNGDGSLGTVLNRTSAAFQCAYQAADVVIAKGQANYECLNEENKSIFFLLMTKCNIIADDIGVAEKKLVCMKSKAYKRRAKAF